MARVIIATISVLFLGLHLVNIHWRFDVPWWVAVSFYGPAFALFILALFPSRSVQREVEK